MIHFFYFVFALLINNNITQQNQTINRVDYNVSTKLLFNSFDGEYSLFFDNKKSYFYNNYKSSAINYNEVSDNIVQVSGDSDIDGFPIYKSLIDNKVEQKFKLIKPDLPCIIHDELPLIKWTILKEKKKIGNFNAIKAEGTMGGRTYVVWFTKEIPIPNGPFKLQGLPGLILEAQSKDGKVSISFKSYTNQNTFQIKSLTNKFNYPVFDHSSYLKKKQETIDKISINMKSRGYNYIPPDNKQDWQIEKEYF